MGKTTVLRAVERDLTSGLDNWLQTGTSLVPIYIDGLVLPRPLMAEYIWGYIYSKICAAFKYDDPAFNSGLPFSDFLSKVSTVLDGQESVPKIVVIFDEIEHIVVNDWSGAFFSNWRALLSNYPGVSGFFSAVFSGALEMASLQHDVGSPLMDVLQWRSLRSLSLDDTRRLMAVPTGLTISDDCARFLFAESGGHPMIVQYAMQKALNTAHSEVTEGVRYGLNDFEENRAWQFGEWWSKYCDETSQLVYSALPANGDFTRIAKFSAELGGYAASKAFEVLQHVGLVEINLRNKEIRRLGNMFSRWHQSYGSVAVGATFDFNLAEMLDKCKAGLRDKYVSAWAIYGKEMPNYSGAVSEMRDLITIVLHAVAPDSDVEAQLNFKFERDQDKPTRRQRVMFLFGAARREQGKSVASEDELMEAHSVRLASILSKVYANASSLTHTTATRPLAYQALKQGESILVQLLSQYAERVDGE